MGHWTLKMQTTKMARQRCLLTRTVSTSSIAAINRCSPNTNFIKVCNKKNHWAHIFIFHWCKCASGSWIFNAFFSMEISLEKRDLKGPSDTSIHLTKSMQVCHHSTELHFIHLIPKSSTYILLLQERWIFPSIIAGEKKLYSGLSSAVTSTSSGQYSETTELVTLELLLRCSLQSTLFGYDRIFTASIFGRRHWLAAAEVQNLLAAKKSGPAGGSHFPVSAPLLIGEKNYMVKNAAV